MALLINSAGGSAADPILRNLGIDLVVASSSMDVAVLNDVWVDTSAGFAGTNSIKSSLSPSASVLTSGNAGTYSDSTKRYSLSSTAGLSVGDYIFLSHASLTAGIYKISSIPVAGSVLITNNPLNGQGDKTGIAYQIAWKYAGTSGTAPISSSPSGQINYLKSRASDSANNVTDSSDTFYVRDAPSGTDFIVIDGKDYTGQITSDTTPSFNLLPSWSNKGGVSHVELTAHSVQAVNNFQWGDATTAEKPLSSALTSGFLLGGGDGIKYGRILLKSASGAAVTYGVDISITVDSAGPILTFGAYGR
jgi:hypothetical protein